jgi:hypothetical protein
MQVRDRRLALVLVGAAALAWLAVVWVAVSIDPLARPENGIIGAVVLGVALGLTTAPLFWIGGFLRQRRIAYRGDWQRALRRGAWVALLAALLVELRVLGMFEPAVGLLLVALVVVAEMTLSGQREG